MDTEKLVGIIRSSTEEVFSMMLGLPIECGESHCEQLGDQSYDGVVAVVGLAGAYVGTGRISCSAKFACTISSAMLATVYESVDDDVLDAMAEVTNMIIGNVKSQIENDYGPMGLSIPTVIFGRNYRARSTGAVDWTVVPFVSGNERMEIRICLAPGSATSSHRADIAAHQTL